MLPRRKRDRVKGGLKEEGKSNNRERPGERTDTQGEDSKGKNGYYVKGVGVLLKVRT